MTPKNPAGIERFSDSQFSLSYDSGSGNGPFGFGWSLFLPSITRRTDKGLRQYDDADESDVYILAGAEDLVPVLQPDGTRHHDDTTAAGYTIQRYRPRVDRLFARIERWTRQRDGDVHWRSISKDNIVTLYGREADSRVADPEDPLCIFTWLICETRDDKGNAVLYGYKREDGAGVDLGRACERNSPVKMSRFDHAASQEMATTSAAVSAPEAAIIAKAIVSVSLLMNKNTNLTLAASLGVPAPNSARIKMPRL
jgi:hypothetical protein